VPDAGWAPLAGAFCVPSPGVGSETATALSWGVATGCAEAGVVNDVTDVKATATAALMSPQGIDTLEASPKPSRGD